MLTPREFVRQCASRYRRCHKFRIITLVALTLISYVDVLALSRHANFANWIISSAWLIPTALILYFELLRILAREKEPFAGASRTRPLRVTRPPGGWLLNLVDRLCRKMTAELVTQMVADMRIEHFEALNENRHAKAQWIVLLHYVSMARALTLDRVVGAALNYAVGIFRKP